MSNGTASDAGRKERRGEVIGLREDDGWAEETWGRALDASRPPESGGGGGRGGRGSRDESNSRDGSGEGDKKDSRVSRGGRGSRDETEDDTPGRPEDRPWTPIPRQAKAAERGLIPPQRRLKKTSRSA